MAGDREEESTAIESVYSNTEETAAFHDDETPKIDPWVQLTDGGADGDPEVIDAVGWVEEPVELPPDGPVPAPMDTPPPDIRTELAKDLMDPPPRRATSLRREIDRPADAPMYARHAREMLNQPVVIARRTKKKEPKVSPSALVKPSKIERRYPKMMALLNNPEALQEPSPSEPPPPPVPGTFFPAARAPIAKPAPADLDEMLAAMAEGLLIGETADGGTEVRVTLKDEFFAGTELRIRVGAGTISAELMPPDREIYWQLNANIQELRGRLETRGLAVEHIVVIEP